MRKTILFTLLLAFFSAYAQEPSGLRPGKALHSGAVTLIMMIQGPVPIPIAGLAPSDAATGVMLMIESTNQQTTDFIVTVNFGETSVAQRINRDPGTTAVWFACNPDSIKSIAVEEMVKTSSETFAN